MSERSDYIRCVSGPLEAKLRATIARLSADRKALIAALEPFALLAPSEDSKGVNMADPLSKWFTLAQLVQAHDAITQATTPAEAVAVGTSGASALNPPDAKATEVVVPREPTDEMIAVAEQASQMLEWQIRASWAAMISTAEQEGSQ